MDSTLYVMAIVLIFGVVIMFHEAGHFIVAKLSGMKVYEFAMGFGPILGSFTRHDTRYSIRALPLGGFVRVAGLEGEEDEVAESFNKKPIGLRIATIAAGPVMNVVLAAVIFSLIYSVFGRPVDVTEKVERVLSGKPAALAGIEPGDELVAVNGITGSGELRKEIRENPGKAVTVTVERNGERLDFEMVPAEQPVMHEPVYSDNGDLIEVRRSDAVYGYIGVVFEQKMERLPLHTAMWTGLQNTWEAVAALGSSIGLTFKGKAPVDVRGPVGIVSMMYEEAQVSWIGFLQFAGIFNVMIAFLNLLPFPALDGSRIVFLGIEGVRGRPVDPRKEALVHTIGLVVLLFFVLIVTVMDVFRIWGPH